MQQICELSVKLRNRRKECHMLGDVVVQWIPDPPPFQSLVIYKTIENVVNPLFLDFFF
jgi:hypothetical protein